ncbi:MAG: CDP-diacylglycerol--glycerol-3-phosphate 3-phosphatidyltransferase [Clostridia bacterium]|nr:CDP-diacylglycerol--glycerol-3-phosphate 3-phosphatidyltransferase [Clostridia bacterium]
MNLPNKLTVMRMLLVPVILVFLVLPDAIWTNMAALAVFCIASFTDYLDGHIARKYNLITDFGKFLDPLADKFMVLAAVCGLIWKFRWDGESYMFILFIVMLTVTIFRELAVASIRLITVQNAGVVVAANMLGKIKTVTQMACIIFALLEPTIYGLIASANDAFPLRHIYICTYVTGVVAIIFTVWSGLKYIISLWKYISPDR